MQGAGEQGNCYCRRSLTLVRRLTLMVDARRRHAQAVRPAGLVPHFAISPEMHLYCQTSREELGSARPPARGDLERRRSCHHWNLDKAKFMVDLG